MTTILADLLKDSAYRLEQFKPEHIAALLVPGHALLGEVGEAPQGRVLAGRPELAQGRRGRGEAVYRQRQRIAGDGLRGLAPPPAGFCAWARWLVASARASAKAASKGSEEPSAARSASEAR